MKNCVECGREFEPKLRHPHQRFCSGNCRSKNYERKRSRDNFPLRQRLIALLGGRCIACGLDDMYALTLDHIKNDRNGKRNNIGFLRKMLKQLDEAREILQVLCWNHNAMKEFYPKIFYARFPHLK